MPLPYTRKVFSIRKVALIAACCAFALPAAALANGASDDQYVDPLAGLTGSGGNDRPKKKSSADGPSNGYSATGEAVEVASEVTEATESEEAKGKSKAPAGAPSGPPALDINALSGIGPLVAVPVKHVTLVVGDIANERG